MFGNKGSNPLSGVGLNQALYGSLNNPPQYQQVQGTITAGEVGEHGTRVTINVPDGFIIRIGMQVTIITHN